MAIAQVRAMESTGNLRSPKAGVAGSNPAGGTSDNAPDRSRSGAFLHRGRRRSQLWYTQFVRQCP